MCWDFLSFLLVEGVFDGVILSILYIKPELRPFFP